jgi:methyl-accepting chemotaxis protein
MNITISENLKKFRKQKGNTQEEVAEYLGISMQAVSKWERGESYPDITLIPALAFYYNVTSDKLLGIEENAINAKIKEYMTKREVSHKQKKILEMLKIVNEMQETNPKLALMAKAIKDIASNSNTVAIEAVDTSVLAGGDNSRIFGVIAEEMRTLALKSESAAAHAADIVEKSAALTDTLDNSIKGISVNIMAAGDKIQEMSKIMNELHEASIDISKIQKTMDTITFQTNLIAIMGTVEAARVGGDLGKSFTITAENIRNLAQNSASYFADIAVLIEKNTTLTNNLNNLINELYDVLAWIK